VISADMLNTRFSFFLRHFVLRAQALWAALCSQDTPNSRAIVWSVLLIRNRLIFEVQDNPSCLDAALPRQVAILPDSWLWAWPAIRPRARGHRQDSGLRRFDSGSEVRLLHFFVPCACGSTGHKLETTLQHEKTRSPRRRSLFVVSMTEGAEAASPQAPKSIQSHSS